MGLASDGRRAAITNSAPNLSVRIGRVLIPEKVAAEDAIFGYHPKTRFKLCSEMPHAYFSRPI
jgi:hypothetical protein